MLVPAGIGLRDTELPAVLCCSATLVEVGDFIKELGDCVSVSFISEEPRLKIIRVYRSEVLSGKS